MTWGVDAQIKQRLEQRRRAVGEVLASEPPEPLREHAESWVRADRRRRGAWIAVSVAVGVYLISEMVTRDGGLWAPGYVMVVVTAAILVAFVWSAQRRWHAFVRARERYGRG